MNSVPEWARAIGWRQFAWRMAKQAIELAAVAQVLSFALDAPFYQAFCLLLVALFVKNA